MTEQLPAASSWLSAMAREVNAKATAATNDATAVKYSMRRVLNMGELVLLGTGSRTEAATNRQRFRAVPR